MQDVLKAMNAHGLYPDSLIADGQIHRFKVDGDSSGKAGWYVGFENTATDGKKYCVFTFGNYRTNLKETYRPSFKSQAENSAVTKAIADQQKKFTEEKENSYREMAQIFSEQWANDTYWDWPIKPLEHPYLKKKNLNYLPDIRFKDGVIYIPVRQFDGLIWSYQRIYPDGSKKFSKGGQAKGGHFIIEGDAKEPRVTYICEGFATGVSIFMATRQNVMCCLSSQWLPLVAQSLSKTGYSYIIAGDDDVFNTENGGRKMAVKAAQILNCPVVFPKFKDVTTKPNDFNDLLCLEGLDELKRQLAVDKNQDVVVADNVAPLSKDLITTVLPHWKWSVPNKNNESTQLYPLATIDNLKALLDHLNIVLRYNVISKQEEILIPNCSFTIDNEAVACLAWIKSLQSQISMPTSHVGEYITNLSERNQYNPVVNWVNSKSWDGVSRLNDFYSTLIAVDESKPEVRAIKEILIKRWMISAIAAAFGPRGVSAHGVLVLQGEQYIGKTAWLKSLAPRDLNVIADGKILKPDDKDSVNQAIRYWIVELGELDATFRKADMAQLKAFLTKDSDLLRRAFAPKDSQFARRTVFFASVNPKQFLHDSTGNRRFWTIECKEINYNHGLDMQQLWAEFYELYKSGENWVLNHEEMKLLNTHNEAFLERDSVEELIGKNLNWDAAEASWTYMTSTEVLKLLGIDTPRQSEKSKTTHALLRLNGSKKRVRRGYVEILVPPNILPVTDKPYIPTTTPLSPPHPPPRNYANDL